MYFKIITKLTYVNHNLNQFQLKFLRNYCTGFARSKVSATSEQLIEYAEKFTEFDAILTQVSPSSPWVSDDQSYWLLNQSM